MYRRSVLFSNSISAFRGLFSSFFALTLMVVGVFSTAIASTESTLAKTAVEMSQLESTQPVLLTAEEARKFCLEVWFPRLRVGHVPTPSELSAFVDRLLELYTEDSEMIDPNNKDGFGVDVLRGKADLKRYFMTVLRNYPEWNFTILGIFPTEAGFVLRYEGRNAPPVERFEGVDIVELKRVGDSWKISKLYGYYDRKPFSRDERR